MRMDTFEFKHEQWMEGQYPFLASTQTVLLLKLQYVCCIFYAQKVVEAIILVEQRKASRVIPVQKRYSFLTKNCSVSLQTIISNIIDPDVKKKKSLFILQ